MTPFNSTAVRTPIANTNGAARARIAAPSPTRSAAPPRSGPSMPTATRPSPSRPAPTRTHQTGPHQTGTLQTRPPSSGPFPYRPNSSRPGANGLGSSAAGPSPRTNGKPASGDAAPDKILFQSYFKSVGPRTYASQVKLLKNDNHMLVLTVGRPNPDGGEPLKSRFIVFAEDFVPFFRLLQETAQFIKAHPLPEKIRLRRQRFWEKQASPPAAART